MTSSTSAIHTSQFQQTSLSTRRASLRLTDKTINVKALTSDNKKSVILQKIDLTFEEVSFDFGPTRYGEKHEVVEAEKWKNRVFLATYPRSGNHWMRYLIEEATHIATSSSYIDVDPPSDPQHLKTVFPWGGYCCNGGYKGLSKYPKEGETVVVKTHFPAIFDSNFDFLPYNKTVRIVRHPVDSIYSYYLFLQNNIYHQPAEDMIPRDFLLKAIDKWYKFQNYWNQAENVLTIRYEDLYNKPASTFGLVLEAVGYPATKEDIERAIAHYPPTGGLHKHTNHFTTEDLSLIKQYLEPLMEQYGYEITVIPAEKSQPAKVPRLK